MSLSCRNTVLRSYSGARNMIKHIVGRYLRHPRKQSVEDCRAQATSRGHRPVCRHFWLVLGTMEVLLVFFQKIRPCPICRKTWVIFLAKNFRKRHFCFGELQSESCTLISKFISKPTCIVAKIKAQKMHFTFNNVFRLFWEMRFMEPKYLT